MDQPTVSHGIVSDGVSSEPLILRAEELAFKNHPSLSLPTRDNDTGVVSTLLHKLVTQHLLTLNEISSFLVEQPAVQHSQTQIEQIITQWIRDGHLIEIQLDSEQDPLISLYPVSGNMTQTRIDSKKWAYLNTQLNSRFKPLQKTYNNLIKQLDHSQTNSYNLVVEPLGFSQMVKINGAELIMFSSNDYLGLARHPEIVAAAKSAYAQYGNSTSGSRIMTGTTTLHRELEHFIAQLKGSEDAIIFSSGFLTNLALMSVFSDDTIIFFDSLNHACIIDGIKLSGIKNVRFKHNNIDDLNEKLTHYSSAQHKVISVESIYSLDGDICRLPEIINLANQHNAIVVVDEAHSTGTIGKMGKGISDYFDLPDDAITLKMGTLGKALGGQGGYIAGPKRLIDAIRFTSRPYLFSTSLPAPIMAGTIAAIEILNQNPNLPIDLQEKSKFARELLLEKGFDIGNSKTQIIPIIIPNIQAAHTIQKRLQDDGFFMNVVTYPAVPPRLSRLRLNINTLHSKNDIKSVVEQLVFQTQRIRALN